MKAPAIPLGDGPAETAAHREPGERALNEATEAELRAVFGPRADYYVAQWRGTAPRILNRAAAAMSGLWLPYRRLYKISIIVYTVIIVEDVVFSRLHYPSLQRWVDPLGTLMLALVCAVFGNSWYLARTRRVIAATRARALAPEEHLTELARAGGTRVWHALAFIVLAALAGAVFTVLAGQ